MRSVVVLLLAVALAVAIPTLATARNGEKPERVPIAHLAEIVEGYEADDGTVGTLYVYHVIVISDRALQAHLNHGDIADPEEPIGSWFEEFVADEPTPPSPP